MRHEELLVEARARFLSSSEMLYKIACLVDKSDDPPSYLNGHLSILRLDLAMNKILDEGKLSRAQYLKAAKMLARFASAILIALEDENLLYALICGPYLPPDIAELKAQLRDLLKRTIYIANDPLLVTPTGDAKCGAGMCRYPWPCSIKLWIAIIVVAAMEHQHGELPRPRNTNACDAAELLWVSVGGHQSHEQSRNSWRRYIREACQERWALDRDSIYNNIAFRKKILDLRDAT